MNAHKIDAYIKSKLDSLQLDLDKDKAWSRLAKKRIRYRITSFSVAAAAVLLLGIFLITVPDYTPGETKSTMSELEKRQKLHEYERRMSGTYKETLICEDCSGVYLKSSIKEVPQHPWILQVY
jgi:hypothetical protein